MKDSVEEAARTIPVTGNFDVVVVGGGVAGVAAAVAAARNSVRVCLLEKYCGLGGLATLGNVTMWLPICDGRGNQVIGGLGEELLKLSVADLEEALPPAGFAGVPDSWVAGGDREKRVKQRYRTGFNPSAYMLALEQLVSDAGVKLLYDTGFCSVLRNDKRISHVIVENKSGRSAIACGTVVDATGDADVCFAAGEETVSLDSNVPSGWFYTLTAGELRLHSMSNKYCHNAGKDNAQGPFFRGDDAGQVTEHILQTRKNIRKKLQEMRAAHSGRDVQLLMPPMMACFRMTRRLVARFTLAERHMHQWFDDTVGLTGDWRRPGPVYAVPFACLCGVKTANLLVAGRCISVDHSAWDALRAIPPCVVTGEAAGNAAALAATQTDGDVTALEPCVLQDRLRAQGVILDPARVVLSQSDD